MRTGILVSSCAVLVSLSGCIVAPCPKGQQCDQVVVATGGTPGSGGQSGSAGAQAGSSGGASADADGKPPPSGTWKNVTANLANLPSSCGNMSTLAAKPDEDVLLAGISSRGVWASTDGSASWHQIGSGAGSTAITNTPTLFLFDPDHPKVYWESGTHVSNGVFQTSDDGATFVALGNTNNTDVVSVDLTDPERKTLVIGGHEQPQTLYKSTDSGKTWENLGANLPPKSNFSSYPLVIDATTYLLGISGFGGGLSGIFRSTDAGVTWKQVDDQGGRFAPVVTSTGDIYWPMDGDQPGIVKSTDKGVTWTTITQPGILSSVPIIQLPDGRLCSLGQGHVMASADDGASWEQITTALPFGQAIGVIYSKFQKAFFVWRDDCLTVVPADAIERYDFDYQTE